MSHLSLEDLFPKFLANELHQVKWLSRCEPLAGYYFLTVPEYIFDSFGGLLKISVQHKFDSRTDRYPTSYPRRSSLCSFESFFSFMESVVVEYAGCDRISASKNSNADSDTSRFGEDVCSVE